MQFDFIENYIWQIQFTNWKRKCFHGKSEKGANILFSGHHFPAIFCHLVFLTKIIWVVKSKSLISRNIFQTSFFFFHSSQFFCNLLWKIWQYNQVDFTLSLPYVSKCVFVPVWLEIFIIILWFTGPSKTKSENWETWRNHQRSS